MFGDRYAANGTRGRNGIPDIVDQIKWGLDWLDKMNPAKGELYNQIADDRDHIGMKMPKDDPADYGRGPGGGRPVYYVNGKPQQRGKYLNATMGGASTAGKFASDFAVGSKVLAPFYPDFAAHIGAKAADAYQVGIDMPGNAQTVSVVSPYIYEEDNWVDDMELGAIELYRMTGDTRYLTQAIEYGRREPVTPWMGADSARHYQWYPFINMGHYRVAQEGNERVRAEFIRNLQAGLQRVRERAADHPFLWGVPGIWCSNNLTTALLTQCILYRQLTGDSTYDEMEAALRDWLLGCNPWGTSMVVELPRGGTYPRATHSNWVFEQVGSPTGGLVDGPVYATIFNSLKGVNITDDMPHVTSNAYHDLQPGDVVYHDNTHDYSTNEPTMDGTAALTFPLAEYGRASRGRSSSPAGSLRCIPMWCGGCWPTGIMWAPTAMVICSMLHGTTVTRVWWGNRSLSTTSSGPTLKWPSSASRRSRPPTSFRPTSGITTTMRHGHGRWDCRLSTSPAARSATRTTLGQASSRRPGPPIAAAAGSMTT